MKRLMTLTIASYLVLALSSAVIADTNRADLFRKKCTGCHGAKQTCAQLGNRDKEAWKKTVLRMMTNGAKMSGVEAENIANWLGTRPKGAPGVCR